MKIHYILTLFMAFVLTDLIAQKDIKKEDDKKAPCQVMTNKKALKAYAKGIDRKKYKKAERMMYLKEAIKVDTNFIKANYRYAMERIKTLTLDDEPFKPADQYFLRVIDSCPEYHSNPYYFLGFSAYEEEKWEECITYFQQFLDFKSDNPKKFHKNYKTMRLKAKRIMYFANFYNTIYGNPVPFKPFPVKGVCTEFDEYLPALSPDGQLFYFTRKKPTYDKYALYQKDEEQEWFSVSKRNKVTGEFTKGSSMKHPFNKGRNEGGATISIDNKHLFFTICDGDNCDIYTSDYANGKWSVPTQPLGVNDPMAWDSQPTLASDGKTLYFVSNRPGGYGGTDIYKTVRDEATGAFTKPENLGKPINTRGDEMGPFIHSDFSSLYFSSDGHLGIGGHDIFYSRLGDTAWSKPTNIGIPINTEGDDLGFFVSMDGKYGYFSSDLPSRSKSKGVGRYDIFQFELYKAARPDEVMFVKGKVAGEFKNSKVEIVNTNSEITEAVVDSLSGAYVAVVNIKDKTDLLVTVTKEDGAFSSKLITKAQVEEVAEAVYADTTDKEYVFMPVKANMRMDKAQIGQKYRLNDINYATNSAKIASESKLVINHFVHYLKDNPSIHISIHGHTDNLGDKKSNLILSTNRASQVRDLIVAQGIDPSRIIDYKGFGASVPLMSNETKEGRAMNRRTEFVIISK